MNVTLIRNWIDEHSPNGIAKLAGAAEVSVGTIINVLKGTHSPSLGIVRRLAKVMGVSLDEISKPSNEGKPPAA